MSMDYNSAPTAAGESSFGIDTAIGHDQPRDLLTRLVDASNRIPGLTFVSNDNLEVLEHLGSGRDLIVTGPDRVTSLTCAALPAIAGTGLIVFLTHSIQSIKKHLSRFSMMGIKAASFDVAPTKSEKRALWERMDRGSIDVLVVTPGRLASHRFRERLARRQVSMVLIDQAQLMSPWSHRFIPSYRFAGSFIASLGNKTHAPQKIAITWNPNGRIHHDLTKLLKLTDPYHGRLSADAVPGLAIETKSVSSDHDRHKAAEYELDRSGGQGVIYCNSIKQMYDMTELLTGRGEEFAVLRPGIDEFKSAQIRHSFEQGKIRVVVSLGSFLPDIESTSGLEFVVFNGMPESVESMGRELLSAEDAGFIRCVILVGEKDYFQHRFSIDKNYPDALVLRSCVQSVRDVFGSKNAVTPDTLAAHVKTATPFPQEDVEQCLQVLIREGMLERVVDQDSGQTFVKFNASTEDEASFWHEYPLRKIDHVGRLDRIREFVAKDGDRSRQLLSLIRQ